MELVKIFDKTCDTCRMLAGIDEEIADDHGFFFRQLTLEEVAKDKTSLRGYVLGYHVDDEGMVDIPVYMLITPEGAIQASGVIHTVEELNNLINSWKKWESSKSA